MSKTYCVAFARLLTSSLAQPADEGELFRADWIDARVLACLAKNPDERPHDADDVLRRTTRTHPN